MRAEAIKRKYLSRLKMTVVIRRYTGSNASRTKEEVTCRAHVSGYAPHEFIGAIQQGDQRAVIYAPDLEESAIQLPLTTDDKVLFQGKELKVMAPVPRRALEGDLCAYELWCRG